MNPDIKSQIDRAKMLLKEFEQSAQADLAKQEISTTTKNLTQEVLLKMNRLFDQTWRVFFVKYYAPKLSKEEIEKTKIYFPIAQKSEDLKAALGRCKIADLGSDYPEVYKWLESVQPYNPNQNWLSLCKKYADDSHIQLTPQTRTETRQVSVSSGSGSVSWGPGVTFGSGISVMGVPIDPRTQMPVPNNIVKTEIQQWVSFSFSGTEINVLWLCKNAVEQGEKIIKTVFSFL